MRSVRNGGRRAMDRVSSYVELRRSSLMNSCRSQHPNHCSFLLGYSQHQLIFLQGDHSLDEVKVLLRLEFVDGNPSVAPSWLVAASTLISGVSISRGFHKQKLERINSDDKSSWRRFQYYPVSLRDFRDSSSREYFERDASSEGLGLRTIQLDCALTRPLLAARQSQNSQDGYGYMVMNNTVIEEC